MGEHVCAGYVGVVGGIETIAEGDFAGEVF